MLIQLIKELRNRTGAGFLDCKKALEFSNNNIEKAITWLQVRGAARAAKKSNVLAVEGIIQAVSNDSHVVIFELNSQTDFVATNNEFKVLATKISNVLLSNDFKTIEEAKALKINDKTIKELITIATAKIGEKIDLRRVERISKNGKVIGVYNHVNKRIAAIIIAEGENQKAIRNIAMHVAAMNPQFLDQNSVPQEQIEKMREEIKNSSILEGKSKNIKENIAKGMLRKQLSELTLVDQEFVMEKMLVSQYLKQNGIKIIKMIRYEVGEGIQRKESNFASEVFAQINI